MVKIQVNSQSKAYMVGNKALIADTDTIIATNNTGATISAGSKVWVNQNSLDKFYSNNINYITIGSLTVNNNIIGNFSSSNYIREVPFNPQSNTWEIFRKITTGSDLNNWQTIFQSCSNTGEAGRFGIFLYKNNTPVFQLAVSANNSSWLVNTTGTLTITANTTYWIKLGFDGTKYYLDYSLDGTNYTRDIEYTESTSAYSPLKYTYDGIYSSASLGSYWKGTMDFSVGYNKINGVKVWTSYNTNVDENTLTGIAQENISAGSSGTVKIMGD